jgi:hypothetical protein
MDEEAGRMRNRKKRLDEERIDEEDVVLIDCDTCRARGPGCADCVVNLFLSTSDSAEDLTESETAAFAVLAGSGLVPPLRLVPVHRPGATDAVVTPSERVPGELGCTGRHRSEVDTDAAAPPAKRFRAG